MFLMTKKGWKSIFRRTLFSPTILILVALFSGCNPKEPEPIVIRETVVVEVPATVIVTQAPEQIEIEVTRVVKETIVFTPTPARTAVPSPTTPPTPSFFQPYPFGDYTGNPEIDDVARTILTRDKAAIRSLLLFQSLACEDPKQDYGAFCRDDEPIGTIIDVFTEANCSVLYTRDEERIEELIDEFVARVTGVYAVTSDQWLDAFGNEFTVYEIIFTTYQSSYGLSVVVSSGMIQMINLGCSQTPDEILYLYDDPIILPPISEVQNNN